MHFLASLLILAAMPLSRKPAIVLVHGAFADASSWSKVIPILQKDGYYVTAVQIPLTSLADDVAVTKRVVDAQKGRVVVVGHSYAGAVITDAAGGDNVKALVYVDAFAPEVDEPLASVGDKFAPPPTQQGARSGRRGLPLRRPRESTRRLRQRPDGGRGPDHCGDSEAGQQFGVRRQGNERRVEDETVVVHRRAP